jgi:sugar phosphate isomerase/epimerase
MKKNKTRILYFCTHWGNALPFPKFCANVRKAGFDGVEMDLPLQKKSRREIVSILKDQGLLLIGQYWQSLEPAFRQNRTAYRQHLENLVEASPLLINAQTGKDYFTLAQNLELVRLARKVQDDSGIRILHETHRGKFLFCLPVLVRALQEEPEMEITLDASHWCNVHESLLKDQQAAMQKAIRAAGHVHARVGFEEGPQVNDPRAVEWANTLETHFGWWDGVVRRHERAGRDLTVTPEFGPAPYMPSAPHTMRPLARQWDVNLHMAELFRKRYPRT